MSLIKTNAITTVAGKPILNSTGSILQVVGATSTNSNSGAQQTWIASPVSATITPTSSSSKVYVNFDLPNNYTTVASDIYLRLKRNGTVIGDNYSIQGYSNTINASVQRHRLGYQYLDSPASTSALTYTIEAYNNSASALTYYMNYPADRGTHSVVLMEVSA
jgi:hypothetical protein